MNVQINTYEIPARHFRAWKQALTVLAQTYIARGGYRVELLRGKAMKGLVPVVEVVYRPNVRRFARVSSADPDYVQWQKAVTRLRSIVDPERITTQHVTLEEVID